MATPEEPPPEVQPVEPLPDPAAADTATLVELGLAEPEPMPSLP